MNKVSVKNPLSTFLLSFMVLVSLTVSSCTKTISGNDAQNFTGIWNGVSTCGGSTVTLRGAGNSVTTDIYVGASGSCAKEIELVGTASGISLAFPLVTTIDLCGDTSTVSGGGVINDTTLSLSITTTTSGKATTCVFTGSR